MVFSSIIFVFYFLPVVIGIYYLADEKYKNYVLLVASLLFYAYGEPRFVFVMIISILTNYVLAIIIEKKDSCNKKKILLALAVCINLTFLFSLKYLNFFTRQINSIFKVGIKETNIALPIGISFFTFQALSYVIDVYRQRVKAQRNLFYVALYVSFFPQLIAGPIVRYSTIEQQIIKRNVNIEIVSEGIRRFLIGFSKKIIIANNVAIVSKEVFDGNIHSTNPAILWLGSVCFSLQIFYDFSGYSDMAIGLGKMFGFAFEENFNYPYMSKSVTEFWRRWHISLGQWFRDYVYIPLGGSRVKAGRNLINLFIVWLFTGVWHGANYTFILWGLGYFVLQMIEKYVVRPWDRNKTIILLWRWLTLIMINFGWVIFNSSSVIECELPR